ncbi:hypothetical protein VL06_17195 [Rossellomorea marisflavi]|nr:hypothetical protein VL06_17195 [Rossellomorea marisflavi]KML29963.1 hypothetical protein VL12_18930 [Rossellomorea marisflavi]
MTKHPRLLLWLILLVPWLTVPFLGKETIKRFGLTSLFISVFISLESILAKKRKWWWFYEKLFPGAYGEMPLVWGQFLIGTLWIMKFSYGKIFRFLLTNFVTDLFFIYPFSAFLKRQGLFSYVRLNQIQVYGVFFLKSILIYLFQMVQDSIGKKSHIE